MKDYHRKFPRNKVVFPDELTPAEKKYDYNIGINDVLHISVWQHPDLTMDVIVRNDGQISFPLIGNIRAEGLSIPEFENELKQQIRRFLQDPQISINPKEVQKQRVFIVGQVRKLYTNIGGKPYFNLKAGSTLLDALSDVEFYPEADLAASYVNRDDLVIPIDLQSVNDGWRPRPKYSFDARGSDRDSGGAKEVTLLGEFGIPGRYKVNVDTTLVNTLSIARRINRRTPICTWLL